MTDYGKEFDDIMIEDNKQSIILLNGLSRTIVNSSNINSIYDVLDMIHMQQEAMKTHIKQLGGSYEL